MPSASRRCCRWTKRSSACWRRSGRRRRSAPRSVSTFDALGRVLAEDVRSLLDVPPEDNSEMDGYALRVADVRRGRARCCASASASPPASVGTAARAGHGRAHLHRRPGAAGADAVVMQELCDAGRRRRAHRCLARGRGSRSAAAARTCGATPPCCAPATRSRPQALGMAASVGAATLHGRARVRASRCSPPATSWRCPASALQAGRDLQLQPLHPARPDRRRGLRRATTSASFPTGSTPPARRCAAPPPATT